MIRLAILVSYIADINCVKLPQMLAEIVRLVKDCVCRLWLLTASNWSLLIDLRGGKSHENNG